MPRYFAFCLILCLFTFVLIGHSNAQASSVFQPSSPVQVVYAIDGSTLTTYDIDPETLEATPVGTLTLQQSVYPGLTASPNGKFLYYTAFANVSQQGEMLYVYPTNASGVPSGTPVQTLAATGVGGIAVDPQRNFVYLEFAGTARAETTPYAIARYVMDPTSGKLTEPVIEANYLLDTAASGNDCNLAIVGFNPAGTTLYDAIFCNGPHGSGSETYNMRSVDPQTGALGSDQKIYSFGYYAGSGYANVQFEDNVLFAFVAYDNQGPNANVVDIYQLPNVGTPLIQCNYSMLAVCGDFGRGLAHPSAKYVFLINPQVTAIGKLEPAQKAIVSASSIPYEVQKFSPDGSIAYAVNDVGTAVQIEIYGFDISSGNVMQGGTINLPSGLDSWWTAQRIE
ncbi:MAG: hypothetical protein WA673_19420 [Candidatus Acidiferrales bacterium]